MLDFRLRWARQKLICGLYDSLKKRLRRYKNGKHQIFTFVFLKPCTYTGRDFVQSVTQEGRVKNGNISKKYKIL